tara:strand:- start:52 stop:252 length:201 start_codon:yes stop_codon:yes gene_type:complete
LPFLVFTPRFRTNGRLPGVTSIVSSLVLVLLHHEVLEIYSTLLLLGTGTSPSNGLENLLVEKAEIV